MSDTRLVVQSDDFGMCHAVNAGIVRGCTEGIVTQASMMAPCPWFDEAASLARAHGIAVGLHSTLTSEWDHLRWGPLAGGPSLRRDDGTFHRTVEEAKEVVDPGDAVEELGAQMERALAAGLGPGYVDTHMGLISVDAYEAVCRRFERPFLWPVVEPHVPLDSTAELTAQEDKVAWLAAHVEGLGPGTHFLITHCAEGSPELEGMTGPEDPKREWADTLRISDLEAVTAPEVRDAVERCGVRPTTLGEVWGG